MIVTKQEQPRKRPPLMKASVVQVPQCDVHSFIARIKNDETRRVPRHIKQVKKTADGNALVIYGMGVLDGFMTVDVPGDYPTSRDEHAAYSKIWPCYYHPICEESVDVSYVENCYERMLNEMRGDSVDEATDLNEKGEKNDSIDEAIDLNEMEEENILYVNRGERCVDGRIRHTNRIKVPKEIACACICLIVNPVDRQVLAVEKDRDDILNHGILNAVTAVSQQQINYLCTGLDAFLLNEPCVSCSMAFVHGRIRRVFYVNNGTGTYSRQRMHEFKKFNHRYAVFRLSV